MKVIDMLNARYLVDSNRLRRAESLVQTVRYVPGGTTVDVTVHAKHKVSIFPDGRVSCTCPDWKTRGEKHTPPMPCKHILALALAIDAAGQNVPAASTASLEPEDEDTVENGSAHQEHNPTDFSKKVQAKVRAIITGLGRKVGKVLETSARPPLLLGPTGTGKTSAVQALAVKRGWGLEVVPGTPSWSDPDLVGLHLHSGDVVGPVTRAMRRAQFGEDVVLFLDEFYQLSERAQALGLHLFQPVAADVAEAMGIETEEPVYRVETPMWGEEWAPVSKLHIIAAANPWGTIPNPALVRRTKPVLVKFSRAVSNLFSDRVKAAVETSWKAAQDGTLPLPMEYGLLVEASEPDDVNIVKEYIAMLMSLDRAAADGFRTLLRGQGVSL